MHRSNILYDDESADALMMICLSITAINKGGLKSCHSWRVHIANKLAINQIVWAKKKKKVKKKS